MQPSIFNLRVPLPSRDQVFLMNTLTDAQLLVSSDVAALLDRTAGARVDDFDAEAREALSLLSDQGFLVDDRDADRRALDQFFSDIRSDTTELRVTV
ncbi:MAG: hypothetical protein DMF91_20110, partial [Acidobacteria bacterium]